MFVLYKNTQIHFTQSGTGTAVVLLHGFLENTIMWNSTVAVLSKKYRVVAIDLLGHGQSENLGYVHTMEQMAESVQEVLSHLKIRKSFLMGHSMGGYVALALAEKEPQLFKGLCLMNSTFVADDDQRKLLRTRANTIAQTNYENLVRMSFANLFAPKSRASYKQDYEDALSLALQIPVQGYIAAQEGMKLRPNRFEVYKNLKGKKILINGKKDLLFNGKKLKEQIKNTNIDLKELSGGHMSHIENKSELTYILKHFIEK